ncbi:MAG: T9SS type A sorting domain-containing protein [Ignavibacteriaceae bacterium]|nr:T9SS type A sorting domain-containing protein [Ignavibacteriaceae bacterium]
MIALLEKKWVNIMVLKIIVLLIILTSFINAQEFNWVKGISGTVSPEFVSTDNLGNFYLTGYFSQTATFENKQIISSGNTDIFIAKYNTDGNLLWLKQAGGILPEAGEGITVDNFGNVNVTGYFQSTATFGSVILMGKGGFVTKISEKMGTIENTELEIPSKYTLSQNYPNPFNPSTSIKFEVPISSLVEISLYTVTGEFVKTLINESKSAGNYEILLEMNEKTSGVYIYVIKAIPEDGSQLFMQANKLVYIK